MTEFHKKFLLEDLRRSSGAGGGQVYLGAFGKHPGWDDHVEDLGLDSQSLVLAKSVLYVQGVGRQIDSGDWEKLDPAQRLSGFKHVMLWRRREQFLVARMWSSSDGKGRKRYPMIVAAHVVKAPLEWVLQEVLPRLERIEKECVAAQTADKVRQLLRQHRTQLQDRAGQLGSDLSTETLPSPSLLRFVDHDAMGPNHQGWCRLLYQIESQLHAYAAGNYNPKRDAPRAEQVRVPGCGENLRETFRWWLQFFRQQVDPLAPLLLVKPENQSWVDIVLGEPTSQEFFSLQASTAKVPMATDVPYNLNETFRKHCDQFLSDFKQGKKTPNIVKKLDTSTTTVVPPSSTTSKIPWAKWLGGGAVLLLAAAGIFLALGPSGKDETKDPPTAMSAVPTSKVDSVMNNIPVVQTAGTTNSSARDPEADDRDRQEEEARLAAAKAKADEEAEEQRIAMQEVAARQQAETERLAAEKKAQEEEEARLATARAEEEEAARLAAAAKAKADEEAEEQRIAMQEEAARQQAETERLAAEKKAQEEEEARLAAASNAEAKEQAEMSEASRGSKFLTNGIGMVLVKLSSGIWVGKYEVTQREYQEVMGSNPSKFKGNPNRPVEYLTWAKAMEFCHKLSVSEQEKNKLPAGMRYALPTLEQWKSLHISLALDQVDWSKAVMSRGKVVDSTAPVGSLAANEFGIHDLLGNVWEWCLSLGDDTKKFAMGGGYKTMQQHGFQKFSPSAVIRQKPDFKSDEVGFRCVLVPK